MYKFAIGLFLSIYLAMGFAGETEIRLRALDIKRTTETQVDHEMKILFNRWKQLAPKNAQRLEDLKQDIGIEIYVDKTSMGKLLSSIEQLPQEQREEVGLDLSSNGKKFSGTFTDHLLAKLNSEYAPILKGQEVAINKVAYTEVKMLLLYLIAHEEKVKKVTEVSVFSQMQFLYDYQFEAFINQDLIDEHFLFDGGKFYMPNSGYVFGGTLREDSELSGKVINRGMDCSAYISLVLQAEYRPSSLLLEVMWKRQMGLEIPYFDEHPEALQELIEKWNLLELEQEFIAVQVSRPDQLQVGDIVVWRSRGETNIFKKSGHVLMVLEKGTAQDSNRFLGIDLRRDDNQEGHYQDTYHLLLPDKDTFVVRKRTL